jgi:hypothetical protein
MRLLGVREFVEVTLDLLGRRETAEHGALGGGELVGGHSVTGYRKWGIHMLDSPTVS